MKCEAIEKRESERREVDSKKHKEEVQYLENYGRTVLISKRCLLCERVDSTNKTFVLRHSN